MEETTLISILNKRYDLAVKFTKKNYIDQAKRSMKDYDITDQVAEEISKRVDRNVFNINDRYEIKIPLIFTNTESMKASLFERLPDLIISGRGGDDGQKEKIINATYEYLKDKLSLFDVADQAAHWFILTGFCEAQVNFENKGRTVPVLDENNEPVLDENGEVLTQVDYFYNDPIVEVKDPLKTYFAIDSQFSYKADKVPYYCWYKLISPEEIELIYGEKVEADTMLSDIDDDEENQDKDETEKEKAKDMTKLKYYCGELPYGNKDELLKWEIEYDPDDIYFIIFTENKVLYITRKNDNYLRIGKWYGHPTDFFGFGLGKIGRPFQLEKTIRRGQQIRFADVAAYPKIAVQDEEDINDSDLNDPRENVKLLYRDKPPQYLQPGNLADAVNQGSIEADNDAQKAFGILDLNTGAQSSTVDTATGQTIFAQASSRRIEFAKKKFMSFYRELIISLFKLCQEHWDEDKVYTIMGDDGQEENITLNKESLKDIDFDKDIDVDMETLSVNKDVVRQQYIVLYDKTKDDPLIERKKIIADMLSKGFSVKNINGYIKENGLQPGTVLINPQTQEQYQIGEDGEIVSTQQTQGMVQPEGQPGQMGIPTNQADVLNSIPNPNEGLGGNNVGQ